MKLVRRKELMAMPIGTVYQSFYPCILGELMVKGATWDVDWMEQPLGAYVEVNDNQLTLDGSEAREALFDDKLRYLVYDAADVEILMAKLRGSRDLAGPSVPMPEE